MLALVALPTSGDLFICAKDLLIEATCPLYWLCHPQSSAPSKQCGLRYKRIDEHARATSEDQRNCRNRGWQYGLVLQQLVAMRRSSWMHVQGPSSAISHAPRTLQMSHVPNNDDL